MVKPDTYWNGEPTPARRVRVIVGPADNDGWWNTGLEGTERDAVEVTYGGQTFYLDDAAFEADPDSVYARRFEEMLGRPATGWAAGAGWAKVTTGHGSPRVASASLPIASVVGDR